MHLQVSQCLDRTASRYFIIVYALIIVFSNYASAADSLVAPDWPLVAADLAKSFNPPAMIHPARNEELENAQK